MADDTQIIVEDDGEVLARATVSDADGDGESCAQVEMASGHLPVGTRQKVVDAVQEAVTDHHTRRLTATVPCGGAELVEGIRDRRDHVELRAAGATSIIRGDVKPG